MRIEPNAVAQIGPLDSVVPCEWFAVRTRPRHEKVAKNHLDTSGIETFLPLSPQLRFWSDRRKIVEFPLFPGYLFVRTQWSTHARVRVFQAQGVLGFVGSQNEATPIPAHQIDAVRALLRAHVDCHPHEYLTVGQRVRVKDGALQGMEGILVRMAADHSLIVSVDLIHRSVAIRLDGYEVEPV
jgi:transcriptional antiterminator NusG